MMSYTKTREMLENKSKAKYKISEAMEMIITSSIKMRPDCGKLIGNKLNKRAHSLNMKAT